MIREGMLSELNEEEEDEKEEEEGENVEEEDLSRNALETTVRPSGAEQ